MKEVILERSEGSMHSRAAPNLTHRLDQTAGTPALH